MCGRHVAQGALAVAILLCVGERAALARPVAQALAAPAAALAQAEPGPRTDTLAGGIAARGQIHVEAGFPAAIQLSYLHSAGSRFAIGGLLGFHYAYFDQTSLASPGLVLGLPMRIALARGGRVSAGLHIVPEAGFFFSERFPQLDGSGGTTLIGPPKTSFFFPDFNTGKGTTYHVRLHLRLNVGGYLGNRVLLGGGLSLTPAVFVRTGSLDYIGSFQPDDKVHSMFSLLLLAGPVLEVRATRRVGLTLDAKLGPYIYGSSPITVIALGAQVLAGMSYQF